MKVGKQLFDSKDVGTVSCSRSYSTKYESIRLTQLITSNIIKVEVDMVGKRPIAH